MSSRSASWQKYVGYYYALQTLSEVRYGARREYDSEDTTRFYVLRIHELGMIKSTSDAIISGFTDWRFWDVVKRELKV